MVRERELGQSLGGGFGLVELVGAAWALGGCCWPLLYRNASLSSIGPESWSGGSGAGRSGRFLAAIGLQPSRNGSTQLRASGVNRGRSARAIPTRARLGVPAWLRRLRRRQ